MKTIIRNSFLNGMARTLDIGGVRLIASPIRQRYISASGHLVSSHLLTRRSDLVDARLIRSDFAAIGNDMRVAIRQYEYDRQLI
jgi:hypothetical protein